MPFSSSSLHLMQAKGSSIEIPRREIARYLGYRRVDPTPEILAKIETCAGQLNERSTPRGAWQAFPLTTVSDHLMQAAGIDLPGKGLARNCRGCTAIVMMAITIGPACDFLIRRAEAVSMTDAAIYQAAGAAMAEAWCDKVNDAIKTQMQQTCGFHSRPRFSPGYGDLPLELQKDFFRILNLPHTCGMSLADTLLMSPSKSVTAFIGLSQEEHPDLSAGCADCGQGENCDFRR